MREMCAQYCVEAPEQGYSLAAGSLVLARWGPRVSGPDQIEEYTHTHTHKSLLQRFLPAACQIWRRACFPVSRCHEVQQGSRPAAGGGPAIASIGLSASFVVWAGLSACLAVWQTEMIDDCGLLGGKNWGRPGHGGGGGWRRWVEDADPGSGI